MNVKCFFLEQTDKVIRREFEDGSGSVTSPVYKRTDTGEEMTWREAPVGAMMYADWLDDCPEWHGPDGKSLIVKTPGGEWYVDSKASNCTKRDDTIHRCWVRHGTPPNITVDKNGNTCAAGAGSIMIGNYHGFLINGELTSC